MSRVDPLTGEDIEVDPITGEDIDPVQPIGTAGGMGDVKQREYEMSLPQPYKDPNFSGGFGQANTEYAAKVPRFVGDVAQTLSTGIVNAAAQGIQDNWGHPLDAAGGVVANQFKNLASPFHTFENPIQSTSESLQRAGVPNTPMDPRNLPYGQFAPGGNAPIMGLADQAGVVADTFTPLFGAGVLAKTLSYIPKLTSRTGEAVGKGMEAVSKSQMRRVVKPLMRHERTAQKPIEETIFEYGLDQGKGGAEPKAIFERTNQKLNQLGAKLKANIKAGKDDGVRINTDKIINDVVTEFKQNPGESEDFYTVIGDIDEIAKDFKDKARAANDKGLGSLDLLQGHSFKQYAGHEGAWQQIAKAKGIPLTAKETTRSKVAEAIYHRLNDEIDAGAPAGIRDLNRQISELIPVKQTTGWRQVIESRGNTIGLNDVIGMTGAALNPKIWPIMVLNRASKSGTVASKIYRLGEKLRSAKTPAEQVRYAGALRKLGLTDEEIRAGMEIVESSGGPEAFRAQDLVVKDAPKEAANVIPFRPSETKATQTGTGALANHNRRLAATQYLQSTTGKEPAQGEVYRFLEQLGENPVPKVPAKPKITREFKGRREDRDLEFRAALLRNGNHEYPTIQVKASEAPDEFTLSGETYKKMKGYDNLTKYRDSKNRQYEFLGKNDVLHMDDPANPYTPPKVEGPTMKDGILYDENGEELFQMDTRKKPTDSPEFKRWFGESKAVDDAGNPAIVYHGTKRDFSTFQREAAGSNFDSGKLGEGFYFSTDPKLASAYAESNLGNLRTNEAPNVMPAHIALKNPLVINADAHTPIRDKLRSISKDLGVHRDPVFGAGNEPNPEWSRPFSKAVQAAGHDGVILDFGKGRREYMVFDPEQIKSATGNRGTFDPSDPNILHQNDRKLNGPSGSILRRKEGDGALITLFKGKANASTWQHEHAHWVRGQFDDATNGKALKSIGAEKWDRDAEEKFARGWERYLYEGKAPSKEIAPAMETMKKRMRDIYKDGQGLDDLPEEMRVLYDAVLLRNKKVSPRAKSLLAAIPKAGKVAVPRLILALKKELENEKETR